MLGIVMSRDSASRPRLALQLNFDCPAQDALSSIMADIGRPCSESREKHHLQ
jgi:hypothetical protein